MRFLNTETLELHEFFDRSIPRYAILSHRWEAGEVSFKDVTKRLNLHAPGWTKIRNFCDVASEAGYEWAWVDTCGIDKTSSAELSEAINSMCKWYRRADVCFVYFCDVECDAQEVLQYREVNFARRGGKSEIRCSENTAAALRGSQWFTRGWTLQELIAPQKVVFFDRRWRLFGSRRSLAGLVSAISGIEGFAYPKLHRYSIATKMSWASNRHCTRPEDMAYSLMGLFDVNMPLLYGEGGRNAFRRLQLEILKDSDDESIFAWYPTERMCETGSMPVLAISLQEFAQCSNIRTFAPTVRRQPYVMTNKGLEIYTVIFASKTYAGMYYLPLNCYKENGVSPLAIALIKRHDGGYLRITIRGMGDLLRLPEEKDLEIRGSKWPSKIYVTSGTSGYIFDFWENMKYHDDEAVRRIMDSYLSLEVVKKTNEKTTAPENSLQFPSPSIPTISGTYTIRAPSHRLWPQNRTSWSNLLKNKLRNRNPQHPCQAEAFPHIFQRADFTEALSISTRNTEIV